MKYDTIEQAAHAWVAEFDAIPAGILEKVYSVEEFDEITPLHIGSNVRVYSDDYDGEPGELIGTTDEWHYVVRLDNGEKVTVVSTDVEEEWPRDFFPMWSTLWRMPSIDQEWLMDHLTEVANCGFRIYDQEDYGLIIGIDGCGYDFYEQHWIPLYKLRGLHWHKEE